MSWNLLRGRPANRSGSRCATPLPRGPNLVRHPISAKLETDLLEVSTTYQTAQFGFWVVISEAHLSLVDLYRGDWAGALSHAQASRRSEPGSSSEGVDAGTLFRQMAYAGDPTGALACFDENRIWMPREGRKSQRLMVNARARD